MTFIDHLLCVKHCCYYYYYSLFLFGDSLKVIPADNILILLIQISRGVGKQKALPAIPKQNGKATPCVT